MKRKGVNGTEIVEDVLNLRQGQPNYNNFRCQACQVQILESDFRPRIDNTNQATICDECLEVAIHLRCMSVND